MKMESNVEFHVRWSNFPNRTCLAIHSENGLESTALANFVECSCGSCDYCQSVCSPFCECVGCEENRINGFSDDTISFSYNLGPENNNNGAREVAPTQIVEKPEGLDFAQSSKQAFYFVDESAINEEMVENGDWFVSCCGSVMAGSRQYLGETIDIPVMGYDGHHSTAGYCESGDTPQFKLFKSTTGEMIDLYSDAPAWTSNGIYFLDNVREAQLIPNDFSMLSAYPNPFNPETTLRFALPIETEVSLKVYNLQGRQVISLVNGNMEAGYHSVVWNADSHSSGIYFVKMVAGKYVKTQQLMLVK